MLYFVRTAVAETKEDIQNKVPIARIHVAVIIDFYQNIQLPSHKKDQPGKTYFFVPPNLVEDTRVRLSINHLLILIVLNLMMIC